MLAPPPTGAPRGPAGGAPDRGDLGDNHLFAEGGWYPAAGCGPPAIRTNSPRPVS